MQNPKGCWCICGAAALALFCTLGLNVNTFVIYIPYLTDFLELSYTQSSSFLVVRNLFTAVSTYLAKYYYEKLDIRFGLTLAMLLSIVAILLYATVTNFTGLCIAAIVSGLCYGLGTGYPIAVLIHRWFRRHEGLAMGICSAGSGLALTVCAPIVTALIENNSMRFAMYCEAGVLAACMLICFFVLKNYPEGDLHFEVREQAKRKTVKPSLVLFAVLALGTLAGGFSYLTVHYTTEGFSPYQVSTLVSVFGISLTLSKFLFGVLSDLWGTYRTNRVFLILAVISCAVCSLGAKVGYPVAFLSVCLFGVAVSVPSVSISFYARDLSTAENFSALQQQFQTAVMLGGLVCLPIPGFVATATGNYRGFYWILTALTIFACIVIQHAYTKKVRNYKR